MKRVEDAYVLSFGFLDRLKQLGYLLDEDDPQPEPEHEESNDGEAREEKEDKSESADAGEASPDSSDAGEEEKSEDSGGVERDEDMAGEPGSPADSGETEPDASGDSSPGDDDDPGEAEPEGEAEAEQSDGDGVSGDSEAPVDHTEHSESHEEVDDDSEGQEAEAGTEAGTGGEDQGSEEGDPDDSGPDGESDRSDGDSGDAESKSGAGGVDGGSDPSESDPGDSQSEPGQGGDSSGDDDGTSSEVTADPSPDDVDPIDGTGEPTEGAHDGPGDPLAGNHDGVDPQHQPDPDDRPTGDPEELEPVDTGTAPDEGGISVKGEQDYGTYEEVERHLGELHAVAMHGEKPDELYMSAAEERAIKGAVLQEQYFETDSVSIVGVMELKQGQGDGWSYSDEHPRIQAHYGCGPDIAESIEPDNATLGPSLVHMRIAFSENKRSKHQRNLKSGKVNTSALGKRAPVKDERLFKKKLKPKKRDYFVLICMDLSGSTVGRNLVLEKRAVMAQAELLARLGVNFAIVGESGERPSSGDGYPAGLYLSMYEIKAEREPWSTEVKERLRDIGPVGANLDGHALEYCRKLASKSTATDRVILYYSDGKMPAENYSEELEILQREIRHCKREGIALLGVGIRTDSPVRHGLDTVQVDTDEDIIKVVKQIEKKLNEV